MTKIRETKRRIDLRRTCSLQRLRKLSLEVIVRSLLTITAVASNP